MIALFMPQTNSAYMGMIQVYPLENGRNEILIFLSTGPCSILDTGFNRDMEIMDLQNSSKLIFHGFV